MPLSSDLESSFHDNPIDEEFLFDCYLYPLVLWRWSTDIDAVAWVGLLFEQMECTQECFS